VPDPRVYGVRVVGAEPGATAGASNEWWRPNQALSRYLQWFLGAAAVLQLALVFTVSDRARSLVYLHRGIDAYVDGHTAAGRAWFDKAGSSGQSGPLGAVTNLVTITVLVLMVVWTYRSAVNARALGRRGERLAPLWAIFGWFIPLASWVLPYLLIQDLWRSSDVAAPRGDGWRALPASGLVRGWWIVRLAGQLLSYGALGLGISGAWSETTVKAVLGIGYIATAAALALQILVVRDVTTRQQGVQDRDPAPTTRPARTVHARRAAVSSSVVTVPDLAPGWKRDPRGEFDYRYWDGSSWTEHVSRGGEWFLDPVDRPPR